MPISHRESLPVPSLRIFTSGPTSKFSETAGHGPSVVRVACPKNRKNRFSLWIPVFHLESVQDHPWRCFAKTRSQDIQKRPFTGCPSARGPVCHRDLCPKNRKNRFSLWIPVFHLESVQDHPWRCFAKTRSQDIQKRPFTGCPSAPGPVCQRDLCPKNRKNLFSLWTPVFHLEFVQDHPW